MAQKKYQDMRIIYLHDPQSAQSVLPYLEDAFPMLEITLIELSDNFDEQFESLNKFFSQFTFRSLVDYAIVADGFGTLPMPHILHIQSANSCHLEYQSTLTQTSVR